MSAYEFKDMATVDVAESVSEQAHMLIEDEGVIKRATIPSGESTEVIYKFDNITNEMWKNFARNGELIKVLYYSKIFYAIIIPIVNDDGCGDYWYDLVVRDYKDNTLKTISITESEYNDIINNLNALAQ